MGFKTLADVSSTQKYQKNLKDQLKLGNGKVLKLHYFEAFQFDDHKGPLVLIGQVEKALVNQIKETGAKLKGSGKCREKDDELEYTASGVNAMGLTAALKTARIPLKAKENKQLEHELADGDEPPPAPPEGPTNKRTPQQEQEIYGRKFKSLNPIVAKVISQAGEHAEEIKTLNRSAQEAAEKGDYVTANLQLATMEARLKEIVKPTVSSEGAYLHRFEALNPLVARAINQAGEHAEEIKRLNRAAQEAAEKKDFATAIQHLHTLEGVLKQALQQPAAPTSVNAALVRQRLKLNEPRVAQAVAEKKGDTGRIQAVFELAKRRITEGDLAGALKSFDALETLLQNAFGPPTTKKTTTPPETPEPEDTEAVQRATEIRARIDVMFDKNREVRQKGGTVPPTPCGDAYYDATTMTAEQYADALQRLPGEEAAAEEELARVREAERIRNEAAELGPQVNTAIGDCDPFVARCDRLVALTTAARDPVAASYCTDQMTADFATDRGTVTTARATTVERKDRLTKALEALQANPTTQTALDTARDLLAEGLPNIAEAENRIKAHDQALKPAGISRKIQELLEAAKRDTARQLGRTRANELENEARGKTLTQVEQLIADAVHDQHNPPLRVWFKVLQLANASGGQLKLAKLEGGGAWVGSDRIPIHMSLFLNNVANTVSVNDSLDTIMDTLLPPVSGNVGTHVTLEVFDFKNLRGSKNPHFFLGEAAGRPGTKQWDPDEWSKAETAMKDALKKEIDRLRELVDRFRTRKGRLATD